MEDNNHNTYHLLTTIINLPLKPCSQDYHGGQNTIIENCEGAYLSYTSSHKEHGMFANSETIFRYHQYLLLRI